MAQPANAQSANAPNARDFKGRVRLKNIPFDGHNAEQIKEAVEFELPPWAAYEGPNYIYKSVTVVCEQARAEELASLLNGKVILGGSARATVVGQRQQAEAQPDPEEDQAAAGHADAHAPAQPPEPTVMPATPATAAAHSGGSSGAGAAVAANAADPHHASAATPTPAAPGSTPAAAHDTHRPAAPAPVSTHAAPAAAPVVAAAHVTPPPTPTPATPASTTTPRPGPDHSASATEPEPPAPPAERKQRAIRIKPVATPDGNNRDIVIVTTHNAKGKMVSRKFAITGSKDCKFEGNVLDSIGEKITGPHISADKELHFKSSADGTLRIYLKSLQAPLGENRLCFSLLDLKANEKVDPTSEYMLAHY